MAVNEGRVMAWLHGMSRSACEDYLPPSWADMTVDARVRWILDAANARALYYDDSLAWVTTRTMGMLCGYTFRNRVAEMRPALRAEGLEIVAEKVEVSTDEKQWAWRIREYQTQREMAL